MSTYIETVIVGGRWAGLASSYYLSQQDQAHVVLEQAMQAGNAWVSIAGILSLSTPQV
jgi:cation diffusion facilitator CzcD-associated flavoprotein CzcO